MRSAALPPDTWRGELENGSRPNAGRAALLLSNGAAPEHVCLRQVMGAQEGKAKPGGGISELNRCVRLGRLPARLACLASARVPAPYSTETLRVATCGGRCAQQARVRFCAIMKLWGALTHRCLSSRACPQARGGVAWL